MKWILLGIAVLLLTSAAWLAKFAHDVDDACEDDNDSLDL